MKRTALVRKIGVLVLVVSWGCGGEVGEPGAGRQLVGPPEVAKGKPSAKVPYYLQFEGDIVARNVPVRASSNVSELWKTIDFTANADAVFLPPSLTDQGPHGQVNPPECYGGDPTRPNSWGGNAGTHTDITFGEVSPSVVSFGHIYQTRPTRTDLNVRVNESSSTFEGNVLTFSQAQAWLSVANPDPFADPCVTFTVTATTSPVAEG